MRVDNTLDVLSYVTVYNVISMKQVQKESPCYQTRVLSAEV